MVKEGTLQEAAFGALKLCWSRVLTAPTYVFNRWPAQNFILTSIFTLVLLTSIGRHSHVFEMLSYSFIRSCENIYCGFIVYFFIEIYFTFHHFERAPSLHFDLHLYFLID